MKYFKIQPSRIADRYEISEDVFERVTEGKQPFEQKNSSGGLSQYGICPSCLNPIQLIGMYKKSDYVPYGRHTGKNIDGLPEWNQSKYIFCPYASHKRALPNDDERIKIDDSVIELYDLLKKQFDRVVYVISSELQMYGFKSFWTRALQQFLKNKTYCYPWLTEANLPYIFAYRGLHQQDIWGQKFLVNSELYNALKTHPNVRFIESKERTENNYSKKYMVLDKRKGFLNLQFRFTKHTQIADQGKMLREAMILYVDDVATGEVIYKKKIEFSELYFTNLIRKQGNESKRQQWLLDISEELMKPLVLD